MLPDRLPAYPVLYIERVVLNLHIYAEKKKVYSFGKIRPDGTGLYRGFKSHTVKLDEALEGKNIYLRIWADYPFIGIQRHACVASYYEERADLLRNGIDSFLLAILFIASGVIAVIIYLIWRYNRAQFFFGIFAVLLAMYTLHYAPARGLLFENSLGWFYVWFAAICFMPVALLGFFIHSIGPGWKGLIEKLFIVNAVFSTAAFVSMGIGFILTQFNSQLQYFFPVMLIERYILQGFIILDVFVVFAANIIYCIRKKREACILLIGFLFLLGFIFYEVTAALNVNVARYRSHLHWGMLGFVTADVVILGIQFARFRKKWLVMQNEFGITRRVQQSLINEFVLFIDSSCIIKMANQKFAETLGYEVAEMIDKKADLIMEDPKKLFEKSDQKDEQASGGELRLQKFITKEKNKLVLEVKTSKMKNETGKISAVALVGDPRHSFTHLKDYYGLSERELEVLSCLFEGMNTKRIGERLFISYHTVRAHLSHIYNKLGVSNRTELIKKLP